jgi:hypothetical protein
MSGSKTVILDKNFIHKGGATRRLGRIVACGCRIVLSDNVVYELCDDSADRWIDAQTKLFDFADKFMLWRHTAVVLCSERTTGEPAVPNDEETTRDYRNWFKTRRVHVPADFGGSVDLAHQQREVETYDELAKHARAIGSLWPDFAADLRRRWNTGEDVSAPCHHFLNDQEAIHRYIIGEHGNPGDSETYIRGAENGLDDTWFTYHHARSILALACVFLGKYGAVNEPGKKFPNSMLDANYLALLHYADGILTDETKGDLAMMLDWLYGTSRKLISSADIDGKFPSDQDIRPQAFDNWEKSNGTHGHDMEHWVRAEERLCEGKWDSL